MINRLTLFSVLYFAPLAVFGSDFPNPPNTEPITTIPLISAEEAAKKFTVPPGFRVNVFAAEPDVQNPIGMAWDDRGRMWVAENYTYAERSQRFDLSLRDRVIILEDADRDGRAESRKVFTDEVQMLTSVAIGHGGVWLMCPPQVLFIPDRDGDDVPDGPPKVMLDGFTVAKDNYHNFANGLKWGPDGWLYGRCGHSCPGRLGVPGTPDEQRVPIKGGIWRFHPDRRVVEVLVHGTTNPWGHDWDQHGELFFINTVNGHLWHVMPGAHFKESSGVSPNPAVYDRLDTIADHYHFDTRGSWSESRDGKANDYGGGHAHIGMMIYQGDQWPEQYRHKLLTLNMHGRRANVERLERHGAGYAGRHEPDVFLSDDPWFRGIEIGTGPDGSGYILDWSDIGECHEHTGVHRTSGRIFRVHYDDPEEPPKAESRDGSVPALPQLWKRYRSGETTADSLRELLCDPDEHVRVWAIRLLTDDWPLDTLFGPLPDATYPDDPESRREFVRMANDDPSGLVHLVLASTLQRLPIKHRAELAAALVRHERFADDHNLPALVWYGLIPLGDSAPASLVAVAKDCRWPLTLRWITRNLAARIEQKPEPINLVLAAAEDMPRELQDSVLLGLGDAFRGWRKAPKPAAWDALATSDLIERSPQLIRELNSLFGDGRALDELKQIVRDNKAEMAVRQTALQTLIEARPDDLRDVCESVLDVRTLSSTAVRGLALFNDPEIGESLAKRYRKFHPADRPAVIETLVSRLEFARSLLNQLGPGNQQIPAGDLTAFHARQISQFRDDDVIAKLTQVWGTLRESTGDRAKLIADWKSKLTLSQLADADLSQGRALSKKLCAQCHTLYGDGGKVGPDLTGSQRGNLDYLLQNILDPSGVVSADFRMSVLSMTDGRVLTGIVTAKTDRTLTLRTLNDTLTLDRDDIEEQAMSPLSMMPDNLLQPLTDSQVRDLIAYLMHPSQVPLPKE